METPSVYRGKRVCRLQMVRRLFALSRARRLIIYLGGRQYLINVKGTYAMRSLRRDCPNSPDSPELSNFRALQLQLPEAEIKSRNTRLSHISPTSRKIFPGAPCLLLHCQWRHVIFYHHSQAEIWRLQTNSRTASVALPVLVRGQRSLHGRRRDTPVGSR